MAYTQLHNKIFPYSNKFPIQLNEQQQDAIHSVNGPVLLLAVPGSGKTTVLVARLGYMVYHAGIAPENILTLTYTVAAARDMSHRFCSYFGDGLGRRLEFRTINGICAKVIQYYGQMVGKAPFSLATNNDVTSKMLSDIFRKTEGGYATESDLKGIRSAITYIKNMMLADEEIKQLDKEAGFKISEIYKVYCGGLRDMGFMDYDDQMVYAYNILRRSPETLQYFQNQYSYICVDEAQDTSKIQHEIIRLLAGSRDNLFMVGDEDQSIYGFRAAYPEALLNFGKDHPGARILLMEQNFRSDAKIVTAADRFIQKNILRHEKHMAAARDARTDISKIVVKDRTAQYHYLVEAAQECRTQTAVLYRNNESVLPLVDRLERQGIPYRIRSAELTFFTHRLVQDIRNMISFAINPKDADLFLQIYYKVSTYISKQDALRICEISRRENRDVLETAISYGQLPDKTRQRCKLIRTHLKCMLPERADGAINRIVYYMGYGDYIERMGMSDGKLFILKAIMQNENSAQRILERLDELQAIMEERQKTTTDRLMEQKNDSWCTVPLILSTIHSSKGLEYDTVYLLDVMDGVFPESVPKNLKKIDKSEREVYEEERRLFYVGITRAKNRLFVFKSDQKSTFCDDLFHSGKTDGQVRKTSNRRKTAVLPAPVYTRKKKSYSGEEFAEFVHGLGEGLAVRHKKLGDGVVVQIQGDRIMIRFGEEQKWFALRTLYEYDLLIF